MRRMVKVRTQKDMEEDACTGADDGYGYGHNRDQGGKGGDATGTKVLAYVSACVGACVRARYSYIQREVNSEWEALKRYSRGGRRA